MRIWSPEHTALRGLPVLALTLITSAPLLYPLAASGQESAQAHEQAQTVNFAIPAGSLTSALNQLARQAGLVLSYDASIAADRTTAGLKGNYTVAEAFARLLRDSGYQARKTPEGYVITAVEQADGPVELPAITVTASTTTNPGYVANQSTTATKTDTPLIETPASVSVITLDQIEQRAAIRPAQALQYTPGVSPDVFGFDTRHLSFNIRGFQTFDFGGGVVFRDGLRSNSNFALYGSEQVVVLRGPASVLYGQGNPGGLVNFVSKLPPVEPLRELVFQPGSFGQLQGKFDIGGPIDHAGVFSYRLTGLARYSGTQVNHVEDDRLYIAPAFAWRPSSNTSLIARGQYQRDNTAGIQFLPASGTALGNPNGKIPVDTFTGDVGYADFDREMYSFLYLLNHRFNETFSFSQKLRFEHFDQQQKQLFAFGLDPNDPEQRTLQRLFFNPTLDTDAIRTDTNMQANVATGLVDHKLLLGVVYQLAKVHDTDNCCAPAPSIDVFDPDSRQPLNLPTGFSGVRDIRQQNIGVYFQDQARIYENWIVTLGGRYDWVDSKTEDKLAGTTSDNDDQAFTWRAGLLYHFDNGIAPYFSYSTSFEQVPGTNLFGKRFEPTTGQQYEIGAKYQPPGSNALFTVAVFDLLRQNILTTDPNNAQNQIQTGEVRSQGIELESKVRFDFGLDLTAAVTLLDLDITKSTEGVKGNTPANVVEESVSVYGDYTMQSGPLSGLGFALGMRYRGRSFGDRANTFKVDPATLVDAGISYAWQPLYFAVDARNLFDTRYVSGCDSDSACYFGSARNVIATLRYTW